MILPYDVFYVLRQFVLGNMSINISGIVIQNKLERQEVINTFFKMYGLTIDDYDEEKFNHDEELYCKMFRDEPKVEVVEVNA